MHADHASLWSTSTGAASHAHPSPVDSAPPADSMQYLEDAAARLPLHVKLEGLAAIGQLNAQNAYRPRVRRSGSTEQAIEHVDVVTCWKGLSFAQAGELAFWEHAFRQCLTSQVEHTLRLVIAAEIGALQRPADGLSLLLDLNERLADFGSRIIDIDVTRISHDMMTLYYDQAPFHAKRSFCWGAGSGNLPRFLCNLIRSQDCFLHETEGSKVLVDKITYNYVYPIFDIRAEIAWFPPNVRFDGVPALVRPHEEYRVVPVYVEPHALFDASSFEPYPDCFHYTVTQSRSSTQWDSAKGCFRMVAPGPMKKADFTTQNSRADLAVSVVTFFPGDVQLERCSRHRITVVVTPTGTVSNANSESLPQGDILSSPASKVDACLSSGNALLKTCRASPDAAGKDKDTHFTHYIGSIAPTVVVPPPESALSTGSPCRKRKAQLPELKVSDTSVYSTLPTGNPRCAMSFGSEPEKRRRVGSSNDEPDAAAGRRSPSEESSNVTITEDTSMRLTLSYQTGPGSGEQPPATPPMRFSTVMPLIGPCPSGSGDFTPVWSQPLATGNLESPKGIAQHSGLSTHRLNPDTRHAGSDIHRPNSDAHGAGTYDGEANVHIAREQIQRHWASGVVHTRSVQSGPLLDRMLARDDLATAYLAMPGPSSSSSTLAPVGFNAVNGRGFPQSPSLVARAPRYDLTADNIAMITSEQAGSTLVDCHGLQSAPRTELNPSVVATTGESDFEGTISIGSPALNPLVTNKDYGDPATPTPNFRKRRESTVLQERHDSMAPEERRPAAPRIDYDALQAQIKKNFEEMQSRPRGLQHRADFIDDFTDTDFDDENDYAMDTGSDDDDDDNEMKDVCSEN
ncbi:hypothetical protein NX059_009919 [Plenodomus lindquistii]|nr:hypothetical protein NX059_009919 [Plenodomus lindquistii]